MTIEKELPPRLATRVDRLSNAVVALVIDAFDEGRATGLDHMRQRVDGVCEAMLRELEQAFDDLSPEGVARVEEVYRTATPSPVVTAHFGGAIDVLTQVRDALRRFEEEPCTPGKAP